MNIPQIIPNCTTYFIPNNSQIPHEKCVSDIPKHKTINNKLNTDVFNYAKDEKNNCSDV